jgi:hypothetical protein
LGHKRIKVNDPVLSIISGSCRPTDSEEAAIEPEAHSVNRQKKRKQEEFLQVKLEHYFRGFNLSSELTPSPRQLLAFGKNVRVVIHGETK